MKSLAYFTLLLFYLALTSTDKGSAPCSESPAIHLLVLKKPEKKDPTGPWNNTKLASVTQRYHLWMLEKI